MIELTFKGEHLLEVTSAMTKYVRDRQLYGNQEAVPVAAAAKPTAAVKAKADAAERMAKARAAKGKKPAAEPDLKAQYDRQLKQDLDRQPIERETKATSSDEGFAPPFEDMVIEPEPEPEVLDPAKLTAIRVKTTEDLQAAYSAGKHTQVLALLSKYGNGAKSFRELQIKDFIPIRKAIDEGALA